MKNKNSISNNQEGLGHLVLLVVIVLIAIGSIGYYVYSRNNESTKVSNQVTTPSKSDEIESLPNNLLTIDKVKELSAKKSEASITGIELESEKGVLVYLVRLSNGSSLLFDAITGEQITTMNAEKDEDSSDNLPENFTTSISINSAVEIAKSQNPGGILKQVEVELEDGKVVISVKFTDGKKIVVDARGGNVIKTKKSSSAEKSDRSSGSSDDTKVEDSSDDVSDDSSNSTRSSDDTAPHNDDKAGSDTHNDDKAGSNSGSSSDSSGGGSSGNSGSGRSNDD